MNNIKAIGMANDGSMKRISVNYDVINEDGKVVSSNKRVNRVITDDDVINAINVIYEYANKMLEEN
jgi:hypothetical protein